MSNYTAMLSAAVAEESSRGAALRGGISTPTAQETARERLKRLGAGFGITLGEWLRFYVDDLNAIEQDAELTDARLLAFMSDYAHRMQRKPTQRNVIDFPTPETATDNKRHYPAALAVLRTVSSKQQRNLTEAGYPATMARVSVGDWMTACSRKAVPAAAVSELTKTKQVATLHGFVLPSAPEA